MLKSYLESQVYLLGYNTSASEKLAFPQIFLNVFDIRFTREEDISNSTPRKLHPARVNTDSRHSVQFGVN